MPIDIIPIWGLFLLTIGTIFIFEEIGYRVGSRLELKKGIEGESISSSLSGIILGLQAFMLAFTFGIVSGRYDNKKELVRQEANVIRTAWHRADFLQEPDRVRSKELLQRYVDERIELAEKGEVEHVIAGLDDAVDMQDQLWQMAVANSRIDMNSDIGSLYVQSVNDIAELHAERVSIGLQARIPTVIWGALYGLMLLGMVGVGYASYLAGSRRYYVTLILSIAFSLVIALIASLDNPGGRLMPVPQQPLINVLSEMTAAPASQP
jgi:hypothetical protein